MNDYASSLVCHPDFEHIFLCGTKDNILCYDIRTNNKDPIKTYYSKCENVLDIAFLNGKEFICSSSIVSRDSADRTIMTWDFDSGAILSNQIYLELYTCPSLKVDPTGTGFVAQTFGDYIAAFSATKPYRIKNKRYNGHKVSGYNIQCDISPDNQYLITGDADGSMFFYNYENSHLIKDMVVLRGIPANKVQWHPLLPSTVASASWNGQVQIWK